MLAFRHNLNSLQGKSDSVKQTNKNCQQRKLGIVFDLTNYHRLGIKLACIEQDINISICKHIAIMMLRANHHRIRISAYMDVRISK